MTTNKTTILVAGYPKSGTTWLTLMLADALNCPSGASVPEQDHKEIATSGENRPGPYIVRKGHFKLVNNDSGPAVPRPHKLAWKQITDEKVVLIVRDPRDIVVSHAHYWGRTIDQAIDRVLSPGKLGSWSEYVEGWLNTRWLTVNDRKFNYHLVKYEKLVNNTRHETFWICDFSINSSRNLKAVVCRLDAAVYRHSFANRRKWIQQHGDTLPRGKEFHLRFMRKGIAGDWVNVLSDEQCRRIVDDCEPTMERLGYNV
jgi:hypothetical protein